MMCPHGDPTCPCPDGDACHYEGPDAMPCPNPPPAAVDTRLYLIDAEGNPIGDPLPVSIIEVRIGDQFVAARRPVGPHCHVEGCGWTGGPSPVCGLLRVWPGVRRSRPVSVGFGCGAARLDQGRPDVSDTSSA